MSEYTQFGDNIFVKINKKEKVKRGCTGKKVYENRDHAYFSALHRSAEIGEELEAYRCRWCSCWHIGHANPSSKIPCPNKCGLYLYRSKIDKHTENCVVVTATGLEPTSAP